VLSQLLGRAVVPLRFGVVLDSDEAVRDALLEPHSDTLAELLERVDGRVQMSVKAYYPEDGLLRAVLARRADLKRRPSTTQVEQIALGREVAAAAEEQRALDEQTLVDALTPAADELRVDAGRSERHLCTVQLLVSDRPRLDAAVEKLTADLRGHLALRYVGPLPPYSFCDLVLEGERWG